MVAYLIKNPPISYTKKLIISEDSAECDSAENFHDEMDTASDQSFDLVTEELQSNPVSDLLSESNEEGINIVDGKLEYKGKVYFSEEALELRVQEELEDRRGELNAIREENIKSGIEEGYNEGTRRANEEYESKLSDILSLFEKIKQSYEAQFRKTEDLLKETIFIAVCKSFKDLLENKNERINVIENVIANIKNTNPVKVKLSQADYNLICNDSSGEFAAKYNIEVDNRVEVGGCIVETDKGIFDGRLEVQLAKLKEAVLS